MNGLEYVAEYCENRGASSAFAACAGFDDAAGSTERQAIRAVALATLGYDTSSLFDLCCSFGQVIVASVARESARFI